MRPWTDHPDHDVRKASDPDSGGEEGDHEPSLPAPLGTVGHGEEQKQGQRPHGQPLHLVTRTRWRETEREGIINIINNSTNYKTLLTRII